MSSSTQDAAAASSASISSVLASASAALASASSASAAAAAALASATGTPSAGSIAGSNHPPSYKIIGIVLAVVSGAFIGSSFVFKKKGLLSMQNQPGFVAGEGHAYLKSPMWWTGMILMIVGEICNFVAYAFTEAILVTPLGALSVVICAVLSSIFLKERLTFFGKIGCLLCILGAVIIALNGPQSGTATTIPEFQKFFLAPGFLAFGSVIIVTSLGLIFWVGPRYGKKNMLVYISICSMIGGLSVVCTSGLGASILTSINGNNQFKHWFIYFLLGFVVVTLLTEINYLNKALELFNTAMVTPTYYVIFTFCTLVTDVILNQGFAASAVQIVTVVFGFFTICCGITLLQMSKLDPAEIASKVKLDRRSTMLLSAANKASKSIDDSSDDAEKSNLDLEDPGVDSVRGFVGIAGSVHRAISARRSIVQRRRSQASAKSQRTSRMLMEMHDDPARLQRHTPPVRGADGILRHSLYDSPMPAPGMPEDALERISQYSGSNTANAYAMADVHNMKGDSHSPNVATDDKSGASRSYATRRPTIGFNEEIIEHRYPRVGEAGQATHLAHYPPAYVPASSPHARNSPYLVPDGRTAERSDHAFQDVGDDDTSPVEASIIEAYDTTPRPERYASRSGIRRRSTSPGRSPLSSTAQHGAAWMANAHSISSAGHATLEQRQSYRNMLEERFQPEHIPDLRLSAGQETGHHHISHSQNTIEEHFGQRATPSQRSDSRGVNHTQSPTMREFFGSISDHLPGTSAGRRGKDPQLHSDEEEEERRGLVGSASEMGTTAPRRHSHIALHHERASWDSDSGGKRHDSLDSLSSSTVDESTANSSDHEAYMTKGRSHENSNRPVRRV